MRRRQRLSLAAPAAIVLAIAALAGCGGDDSPATAEGIGVNESLQLADCDDWNASNVDQRLVTVQQLHEFSGGPVGNVAARGALLDDEDAFAVFDRYCAEEFAAAFKLYKLYTRAASFSGH